MEVTNQLISVVKDNFDVALQVSNTIEIVKRQLIAKLKAALIIECDIQGKKLQWKSSLDYKWTTSTGFGINFSKDQTNDFEVWFEFGQPNLKALYWGIRRKDVSVVHDKTLWNEINQVMSEQFGPGKQSPWWPWWVYYDLEKDFKNWETSPKPWEAVQNGSFVEQVLKVSNEVNQHFINTQKTTLLAKRQ